MLSTEKMIQTRSNFTRIQTDMFPQAAKHTLTAGAPTCPRDRLIVQPCGSSTLRKIMQKHADI